MFKPKQVAPFFSMTPAEFSELLKELHTVYTLNQTAMGSFLLTEKDFPFIESYTKTKTLFGNKKLTLVHLKDYVEKKVQEENGNEPEWMYLIRSAT
ncbi:hypothetical protein U8V72_18335 [Priestia filamentosa]|uniref:hypothetical protein n=1 Tax=Priestia filamentosa TaxID=1402861 RepID=UPI0039783195